MTKDKVIYFISGHTNNFIKYLTSRSLYGRAAMTLFIAAPIVVSTSLLELLVKFFLERNCVAPPSDASIFPYAEIPKYILALTMIGIGVYFIRKAEQSKKKRMEDNRLIFEKRVAPIAQIGNSRISVYCGSITSITGVDLLVTSEDTDLDLGSMSGTSVSGRVRSMAASWSATGDLVEDNLANFIKSWKAQAGKQRDFNLGTCVISDSPYAAKDKGVKSIMFAVGIRKNPSGIASIDDGAISRIVSSAVDHAVLNNYTSLFLPVFGLGSGNVNQETAIGTTLSSVKIKLECTTAGLDVYLGVYRFDDLSEVSLQLSKYVR